MLGRIEVLYKPFEESLNNKCIYGERKMVALIEFQCRKLTSISDVAEKQNFLPIGKHSNAAYTHTQKHNTDKLEILLIVPSI